MELLRLVKNRVVKEPYESLSAFVIGLALILAVILFFFLRLRVFLGDKGIFKAV